MGHEVDTSFHDAERKSTDHMDQRRENSGPETQPLRDSYDSGYEHSWQHWVALRELVEGAD